MGNLPEQVKAFCSRILEQFILTVGQNNFENKIPFLQSTMQFCRIRKTFALRFEKRECSTCCRIIECYTQLGPKFFLKKLHLSFLTPLM